MTDMGNPEKEHYFDWAATSPADMDILEEAVRLTSEAWGNPSSAHRTGKKASGLLESARQRAAAVIGVKPEQIYFTSGGTESDQIPLLSLLNSPRRGTVLISSVEHPAVREQADALKKCGMDVVRIPADRSGIITPEAAASLVTPDTLAVYVMAVNNETGSIQPVAEIADAVAQAARGGRRPKFHTDCVQAAGKIHLDIPHKGIDSAAFSSHKICGPRGTGILYLAEPIEPFLRGGGQERAVRSGTENVLGAVAFSLCLERYYLNGKNQEAENRLRRQEKATDGFISALSRIPGCTVIPESRMQTGNRHLFSPWVVQAAFRGIPGNVMLRALDAEGFCISTGSACSTHKQNRPVLEAMHVSAEFQKNAVRFSFGPHTTQAAMTDLVEAVGNIASRFN